MAQAGPVQAATAHDVAVRRPTVHGQHSTVGDVAEFLAGSHVHLALVVDHDERLLTAILAEDLETHEGPSSAPASTIGTLVGRCVSAREPIDAVHARFEQGTARRLAVVDDAGRLVGLVCRKRSGRGFCSDQGIAERRADRRG